MATRGMKPTQNQAPRLEGAALLASLPSPAELKRLETQDLPRACAAMREFLLESVQRTGGHTADHQIIWIQSGAQRAVYAADLLPTTAHLPDAWILGFDLYPVESLAAKKAFKKDAAGETLIFLPHDPAVAAGHLVEQNGRPAFQLAQ